MARPSTRRPARLALAAVIAVFAVVCAAFALSASTPDASPSPHSAPAAGPCLRFPALVHSFYSARAWAPVWGGDAGGPATQLAAAVADAAARGLDPADYHHAALRDLLGSGPHPPRASDLGARVDRLATRDLLLTDAFLAFATDLARGRLDPARLDPGWHVRDDALDAVALLRWALDGAGVADTLASIGPRAPDYARLVAAWRAAAGDERLHLEAALERWRWLPDDLGARHILVNVPAFELRLVEAGVPTLRSRVVVGLPYRRTPSFGAPATYLVLSPYWNVPPGIAKRDVFPEVRKAPAATLARKAMHVFRGWGKDAVLVDPATLDWAHLTAAEFNAHYWFRADPGPKNPLGGVKIMFPNRYDVYLHDTPSKELFEKERRTFSSGCIRAERALELAERLLAPDPRWTRAAIDDVLARGEERNVALPAPLPVWVAYFTRFIGDDGVVHAADDVYGRDAPLVDALRALRAPDTLCTPDS